MSKLGINDEKIWGNNNLFNMNKNIQYNLLVSITVIGPVRHTGRKSSQRVKCLNKKNNIFEVGNCGFKPATHVQFFIIWVV